MPVEIRKIGKIGTIGDIQDLLKNIRLLKFAEAENNLAHMTANFDPGFGIHTRDEWRISDSSFLLHKFRENQAWLSLRMASGACATELTSRSLFTFMLALCLCPLS